MIVNNTPTQKGGMHKKNEYFTHLGGDFVFFFVFLHYN